MMRNCPWQTGWLAFQCFCQRVCERHQWQAAAHAFEPTMSTEATSHFLQDVNEEGDDEEGGEEEPQQGMYVAPQRRADIGAQQPPALAEDAIIEEAVEEEEESEVGSNGEAPQKVIGETL